MVVHVGPGAETVLSGPPAVGRCLPVVGLDILRSELRQGDGTLSRDKMLMDDVFVTLRRLGATFGQA